MCKTWGRIRIRIGIVFMLIQIRIGRQNGNSDLDAGPDRYQNDANSQHCLAKHK
jgi:hypothetical protein